MSGQGISESVHPRQQQRTSMATLGKTIAIAAQARQDQKDAERLHKYHRTWLALRQVEDTAR